MMKTLNSVIDAREAFIAIYKPIAGWKCVLMSWDDEIGCHTPWETGMFGYKNRKEAVAEGRMWSKTEEIPFFDEVIM